MSGAACGAICAGAVTVLATGPSLMGREAALSGGPGHYPWRRGIITTIFWIGERPRGNNPVPNFRSSWTHTRFTSAAPEVR